MDEAGPMKVDLVLQDRLEECLFVGWIRVFEVPGLGVGGLEDSTHPTPRASNSGDSV
jgi:hypothetical protein